MERPTVAQSIVRRLTAWGVTTVYGTPGDGADALWDALWSASPPGAFAEPVEATRADLAALMACAHAKLSGEVGVCWTDLSGALQLLPGLYAAAKDNASVLVIVSPAPRAGAGVSGEHEPDVAALLEGTARAGVYTCVHSDQALRVLDRALREARARRGVSCLIVPSDLQRASANEPEARAPEHPTARIQPAADALERAAAVLNAAERPAMLVGAGAADAARQVMDLAEAVGAGVAKTLLAKAVVPDTETYVTGVAGLLGTEPSRHMLEHCDALVMIGTNFPYPEWLPEPGKVQAIQIDVDPGRLSARYPCVVELWGDARLTLDLLLPMLRPLRNRAWGRQLEARVVDWWQLLEDRAARPTRLMAPEAVFWELSRQLPNDAVVTCDIGTVANWYARNLRFSAGTLGLVAGGFAPPGASLYYALASKVVYPERPVIACLGVEGMNDCGVNALREMSERHRAWRNRCFVVLTLDDTEPGSTQASPGWGPLVEAMGVRAIDVRSSDELGAAWGVALSHDGPCVLIAHTDPHAECLPPHVDPDKARTYLEAARAGEANRGHIVRQTLRDLFSDML